MDSRKGGNYSEEDIELARLARALGNPARIAILRHLALSGSNYFNEITKHLPIADSTVSQHLAELRDADLIRGTPEPPRTRYSINRKNWKRARVIMNTLLSIKTAKG
jgi:DNA-binding transcriptional ArsR family regulator